MTLDSNTLVTVGFVFILLGIAWFFGFRLARHRRLSGMPPPDERFRRIFFLIRGSVPSREFYEGLNLAMSVVATVLGILILLVGLALRD